MAGTTTQHLEAEVDARVRRKAWLVVFLLFLAQVINYFDKVVVGIAAVPMMKDLGLSRNQFGLVAGSLYALYALTGVIVGLFVVKRVLPKWLLAALVLVWSVSQFPIAFTSALSVLVASRMALGAGEGPISGTVANCCFTWFPNDRRNLPIAVCTLGNGVGLLLGSPVLNSVVLRYGWRRAFLVCGVLGVAWLALWIPIGANGPFAASFSSTPDAIPHTRGLRWNGTLVASFVVAFCSLWPVAFTVSWLPSYLRSGLGYDPHVVGWLLSAIATTGAIVSFLVATGSQALLTRGLSSRKARAWVNAGAVLLGAIALCAAIAVPAGSAKIILLALGFGLPLVTFSIGPPMVAESAPPGEAQRATVIIYAACTLSGLLAPIVSSHLMQWGDAGGAQRGYPFALLFTAFVLLVGAVSGFVWLHPAPDRAGAPTVS